MIIHFKSLLILLLFCTIIMIMVVLSGCLCAAILVYLKNETFIFSWHDDVVFSVKKGVVIGIPTGIGIWILSRLKGNREN
ncbi:immunity protein [Photorhabdus luminescens]|uniref:Immunity protein n=2 Tax=Photorhabdus TaxID=29487 RepID=A0A2S8PUQ1_9GAMM|nr:immunity protein [Photorhabdus hindustanensis]QXF32903.1 immunity protein [Photorhabdus akhurstii]UJD74701.1 immunity protein [Photorhabdus luminescens]